ncbi:hypothetical protein HPP92_002676 [Vanilla planifolia]|uniref:Uncharacterized protein n=1 Tax=Vanilla planifolia TaxID=51239 RepID=A0A835S0D0_VANPL|nr:hypothetical protein HPP92_002676 [Vanilla planifolia]
MTSLSATAMPLPFVYDLEGHNSNATPSSSSENISGDHTAEEREVADIIIYLLHHQGSDLRLRLGFPMWRKKRKRSVRNPSSDLDNTPPSSHSSSSAGKEMQSGVLCWPPDASKEFLLPDLNVSAEELLTAADAEIRRREQQVYETAWRKAAAADARRRRRQLLRLKGSVAADASLCPRVRG